MGVCWKMCWHAGIRPTYSHLPTTNQPFLRSVPEGCTVMETRFMLAVDVDRRYKHCKYWCNCLPAVIPFYRSTVSGNRFLKTFYKVKNGLTARTQFYTWWATHNPTSNTLWVLSAWISIDLRDEGSGMALWCKEWPSLWSRRCRGSTKVLTGLSRQ